VRDVRAQPVVARSAVRRGGGGAAVPGVPRAVRDPLLLCAMPRLSFALEP